MMNANVIKKMLATIKEELNKEHDVVIFHVTSGHSYKNVNLDTIKYEDSFMVFDCTGTDNDDDEYSRVVAPYQHISNISVRARYDYEYK